MGCCFKLSAQGLYVASQGGDIHILPAFVSFTTMQRYYLFSPPLTSGKKRPK
jgi:hypothetical protein